MKNILLVLLVTAATVCGDIIINSPTTLWSPITYGNNYPDPFNDQQTGLAGGDLVGNADNPSFYTQFDNAGTADLTDGTIAFRARLNLVKNESKMVFDYNLFVGMDANLDGALDLFVGIDNSANGTGELAIWEPGGEANTSPSTTSIVNPPAITYIEALGVNYDFSLLSSEIDPDATTLDVDGGGSTDAFVSFSINFSDIVSTLASNGITIDQNSAINYVMATATQANSMNMDLNGISGGTDSDLTFAELGASSETFSPTGEAVPEPAMISLARILHK